MVYNPGAFSDFEIAKLASISNNQTAAAGGGQNALGVVITAAITRFTTVASTSDSATLPSSEAVKGQRFIIINNGANTMNVFGATGDIIGSGTSPNNSQALTAGQRAIFFALGRDGAGTVPNSGRWSFILSA